jgi:hypothetical protein
MHQGDVKFKSEGLFVKIIAEKQLEAQQTRMSPEAPMEGENSNLSNHFGANFLMKDKSMSSFLVSCRQKMFALHSSILFLIGSHFSL